MDVVKPKSHPQTNVGHFWGSGHDGNFLASEKQLNWHENLTYSGYEPTGMLTAHVKRWLPSKMTAVWFTLSTPNLMFPSSVGKPLSFMNSIIAGSLSSSSSSVTFMMLRSNSRYAASCRVFVLHKVTCLRRRVYGSSIWRRFDVDCCSSTNSQILQKIESLLAVLISIQNEH